MKRFMLSLLGLASGVLPLSLEAQWSTTHEQFYLPGSFNWQFRRNYPGADRLFNAFDYGHAILYERLWNSPNAPVSELEQKEFDFITGNLLINPPNLPLEEGAIEIAYAKIAPEAKMMFEWAHLLHRQIYDVLADERMTSTQKDMKVQELIRYYRSRKDLAFSSIPKSMELMEGQPYSLAFRQRYPKFNGLIWAYHWLQIGLYEPLLAGRTKAERQTGVAATVARFRQMIEQPPTWMPRVMPMAPAVAPLFTARFPEAAIIFDNLHSMHDVISDILANPSVSRDQKRAEILKAAKRYRDNTSFVVKPDEWREMASMMGIENMGGPVRGFLAAFPTPTLERGAVMSHAGASGTGNMVGMQHGAAPVAGTAPSMPGMDHSKMTMPKPTTTAADHSGMPGMNAATALSHGTADASSADMAALHTKMMADPVIRARIDADPVMRGLMQKAMNHSPGTTAAHSHSTPAVKRKTATARKSAAKPVAKRSTSKKTTAPRKTSTAPAAKPKPKPDPMAGMDHSKMNMPPKK